jgi:hypothetical protein
MSMTLKSQVRTISLSSIIAAQNRYIHRYIFVATEYVDRRVDWKAGAHLFAWTELMVVNHQGYHAHSQTKNAPFPMHKK